MIDRLHLIALILAAAPAAVVVDFFVLVDCVLILFRVLNIVAGVLVLDVCFAEIVVQVFPLILVADAVHERLIEIELLHVWLAWVEVVPMVAMTLMIFVMSVISEVIAYLNLWKSERKAQNNECHE